MSHGPTSVALLADKASGTPILAPASAFPGQSLDVIQSARALNFSGGMLTSDMLDALVAADGHTSSTPNNPAQVVAQPANDLARTIAPMKEPEPIDIHLRNNLPDWNKSDFSMHASDAPSDITVHYDITGNSTTEGK